MAGIFERNYRCYGYRRMHACASTPNEKWLTDITEFQIPAGKVYLSPMIDCFDGMVVSWSIGTRPDAELVNTMLDAAIESVAASSDRPVVHSDRGGHYRWPGWLSRIAQAQLVRSMSRKACSPDNAACEGFFGRLKNELFYPQDWLSTTIDEFIAALDSYIRWYNEVRIKISLGSRSPTEHRRSLGSRLNQSKISAASPGGQSSAGSDTLDDSQLAQPCQDIPHLTPPDRSPSWRCF